MTKKYKERAESDVGLIFTAYNLRRLINTIGKEKFKAYLKTLILLFISILQLIKQKTGRFKPFKIFENIFLSYKLQSLKTPYI